MKITNNNIDNLPISDHEKGLLKVLLINLASINSKSKQELYIDWQDYHTEYSPEWTDPCPDYYGTYTIRAINNPYESLGVEMTLDDLDTALCLLYNYVVDL